MHSMTRMFKTVSQFLKRLIKLLKTFCFVHTRTDPPVGIKFEVQFYKVYLQNNCDAFPISHNVNAQFHSGLERERSPHPNKTPFVTFQMLLLREFQEAVVE